MTLALMAAVLMPALAFAQASSFDVGGPAHQIFHQVDILNCCAHFAIDTSLDPQQSIGVAGPPWPNGTDPQGNAGSASAFASTRIAVAQKDSVSFTMLLNGMASPGPYDALTAAASAAGTFYSFVLDRPNYVELHVSVSQHKTGPNGIAGEAVARLSLRNGYTGGGAIVPGFAVDTLYDDIGFLHVGPVLLPAGEYALIGSGSAQGNARSGFPQSFSVGMTVTMYIYEAPPVPPSGTVDSTDGSVTATAPDGTTQDVTSSFVISLGRTFNTGPGSTACLAFPDGAHVGLGENSSLAVDDYAYDASAETGHARFRSLAGLMRYLPGVLGAKPDPDSSIDMAAGTIGVGTTAEFIARVLTNPPGGQVYLRAGQLGITPRNTAVTTPVGAMTTIIFDASAVSTSTLDPATYDAIANQIGCHEASPPPSLAITSTDTATFTIGSAWSFAVTTSGSPAPTLSMSGALPAGVTFTPHADGTATIAGTAATGTGGSYPLVITASNGVATDATQNFTLSVNGSFLTDRGATLGSNVTVGLGSWIKKGAAIGNDVVIGSNVVVNQNVTIGDGVRIGDNTIVDQGASIGAHAVIGANVRLGKNVRVAPNTTIPDGAVIKADATVP